MSYRQNFPKWQNGTLWKSRASLIRQNFVLMVWDCFILFATRFFLICRGSIVSKFLKVEDFVLPALRSSVRPCVTLAQARVISQDSVPFFIDLFTIPTCSYIRMFLDLLQLSRAVSKLHSLGMFYSSRACLKNEAN